MRIIASIFTSLSLALVAPASAQSLSDLQLLSDSVRGLAQSHPTTEGAFEEIVAQQFASSVFEHGAFLPADLGSFQAMRDDDWADQVTQSTARMSRYGPSDTIKCLTLQPEGTARLQSLVRQHGVDVYSLIPSPIAGFLARFTPGDLNGSAHSLQVCTGTYHVEEEAVDYAAWIQWYDFLENRFRTENMEISRGDPVENSYKAGFLSARGSVCSDDVCITYAGPLGLATPVLPDQILILAASVRRSP